MIISINYSLSDNIINNINLKGKKNVNLDKERVVRVDLNEESEYNTAFILPSYGYYDEQKNNFFPVSDDYYDEQKYNDIVSDQLSLIRLRRNELLRDTDWTQLPDVSLTQNVIEQYRVYRQELRDIPNNAVNPYLIFWPDMPI